MKKIIAIVLLVLLTVSIVSCKKSDAPDGMMDVAAKNAKFHLYVPETWYEQTETSTAASPYRDGANVNATAYLAETLYTAESYWNELAKGEIEAAFKDLTVLDAECGDTELGGIAAKRYVYDAKLGGVTYRYMQVIAVDGNMVYTLTYTATPDTYATHLEDVESIRANFTFKQ